MAEACQAAARRKALAKSPAAKKQKKTTIPHLAEPIEGSDSDDESMLSTPRSPPVSAEATTLPLIRYQRPDYDNGALNTALDDEGEGPDDWYIEEQDLCAKHTDDSQSGSYGGNDLLNEYADEDLSSDSDGSLGGASLLSRDKWKAQRGQEKRRLQAAFGKLKRGWNTTTNNWDSLTKKQIQALAQGDEDLK
ncbi:hypothetical protein DVH05_004429 [Phytophthora capsici]|nr:hypothetical protein DVH05_004429 [Phytophthora capsici]